MALETLIATVVLPAAIDLLKGGLTRIGNKISGLSVDDQIKLQNADISKLEALAKIDNPYGTPSQWVIDLRASFRYIFAGILVLGGLAMAAYGTYKSDQAVITAGFETAAAPGVFILGERFWTGLKK